MHEYTVKFNLYNSDCSIEIKKTEIIKAENYDHCRLLILSMFPGAQYIVIHDPVLNNLIRLGAPHGM